MVEGARLEIVWGFAALEGSNPFASATFLAKCIKKQDSNLTTFGANPFVSATMNAVWAFFVV